MTAPRRCAKPGCREFHPCSIHPWGWAGYRQEEQYKPFSFAERRLMQNIKEECGYRCYKCGTVDRKGQTDHIINRARGGKTTRDNLQFLCTTCHKIKTAKESKIGKTKKAK